MKHPEDGYDAKEPVSHPAGVRGLKLVLGHSLFAVIQSHPAGVRGLKLREQAKLDIVRTVAPRRGAWIETCNVPRCRPHSLIVAPRRGAWIETAHHAPAAKSGKSHPAGVRGLKLVVCVKSVEHWSSHPAGVRGLKRWLCGGETHGQGVAPRRGAWIETSTVNTHNQSRFVAPRRGAWIETRSRTRS